MINSISQAWNTLSVENKERCAKVASVAAIALTAYLVWGRTMFYLTVATVITAYQFQPKLLNHLDLKGTALAVATICIPFFSGIALYFGSACLAYSLLKREWDHYCIRVDLEEENEKLKAQSEKLGQLNGDLNTEKERIESVNEGILKQNELLKKLELSLKNAQEANLQKSILIKEQEEKIRKLLESVKSDELFQKEQRVAQGVRADLEDLNAVVRASTSAITLSSRGIQEQGDQLKALLDNLEASCFSPGSSKGINVSLRDFSNFNAS